MTLANCRAPFREPAADELGRQHPIIAAQREEEGKKGRKESAIIGTSSAARHRAAISKQTRFAWPHSCSQHPGHDSSHLFLNSPLPISAPRPSSLPHWDRLLHPTDAPRAPLPPAQRQPSLPPAQRQPSLPPTRHPDAPPGRLWCFFILPPPSHSLPPFPPRAAPGSKISALYIKKGQISALVK